MRLIVIGGGAAGFFCAINAAQMNPQLEVIIVEKTSKLLSKVRISGGGRCNVTHACFSIPEILDKYPRGRNFVKKSFHEFFTPDTINWFRERGVMLKTEADGRMFPISDSSATIINCLLEQARQYHVTIKLNSEVKRLNKKEAFWELEFADNTFASADFICIASGGYPKRSMFEWLRNTGHNIEPPVPSLFTFNMPDDPVTKLMGVATSSQIKIAGTRFEETGPLLITHWGLSGPAVLKLSARAARELNEGEYKFMVLVNWSPEHHEQSLNELFTTYRNEHGSQKVLGRIQLEIPKRLWEHLVTESGIGEQERWADLSGQKQKLLARNICAHEYKVSGKTTYKEEFVTAGGIRLSEVEPSTMESRLQAGLYFAGEILDVDGITGGFNFQHAWTSGWVAAKSIARRE